MSEPIKLGDLLLGLMAEIENRMIAGSNLCTQGARRNFTTCKVMNEDKRTIPNQITKE